MAAQGIRSTIGAPTTTTAGCTGESCRTREAWPLHHVKHRGVYVRLCTSCVLKYHPSSFCSLCHDLLVDSCSSTDSISSSPSPTTSSTNNIIHCSSCPNVCHSSCLPPSSSSASSDFFLCPSCSSSAAATADALLSSRRRTLDLSSARSLLCAARLAAYSMSRAAAVARADADRKAKEAAAARKRAREMIERVADVTKRVKEKVKEKKETEDQGQEHDRMEKEKGKPKGGLTVAGAGGSRERDKWMRLYEMPTSFRDGENKPLPPSQPLPASKFEQEDTKDKVTPIKAGTALSNSVSKVNPSS